MPGLPTPIVPAVPTPTDPFPGFTWRRTQDIVTADAFGAARVTGMAVGAPVQLPSTETPWDGGIYAVQNGQWVLVPIQTDAPADGQCYGRMNNQWVDLVLDMGTF